MTSSFQSTAGQIFDSPVNTFVEPVTTIRRSSMADLAEILSAVNPVLTNFAVQKTEQQRAKQKAEGELIITMANPERIQEITNALASKDKTAIKDLIGSNYFVRTGVEKRIAELQGLSQESKLNEFLTTYRVQKEKDGATRSIPLNEFSVNSPEFQEAMQKFQQQEVADLTGIRQSFINQYFLPKQGIAIQGAFSQQQKDHNEFNVKIASDTLNDSIISNFSAIDFDDVEDIDVTNPDSAINVATRNIQKEIKYQESVGLIKSVSPTELAKTVTAQAEQIFLINQRKGKSGVVAVEDFYNVISRLQVGPEQDVKIGVDEEGKPIFEKRRATLAKFLGEDWNKMKARLINAEKSYDDFKEEKYLKVITPRIESALKDFDFTNEDGTRNTKALETLGSVFGEKYREPFLEAIENLDVSRDDFFDEFDIRIINKDFVSPLYALRELEEFRKSLGTTITEEDKTRLNEAKEQIVKLLGKDVLGVQRTKINDIIKQAGTLLGKDNFDSSFYKEETSLYYSDATNALNKKIVEISKNADNLNAQEFEQQINAALQAYTVDIYKINNENLVGTDQGYKLKTNSIWNEGRRQYESEVPLDDRSFETFERQKTNEEKLEEKRLQLEKEAEEKRLAEEKKKETPKEEKKGFRQNILEFFTPKDVSQNTNNLATQFVSQLQDYGISEDDANNLVDTFAASLNLPYAGGGEDMSRPEGGVLVSGLKQMTDKFDQFNGAVSYGSGGREENLKKDPNFIRTIEKDGFSHTYADKSSQEVIDEAKNIYIDLVENNTQENVEAKYAIAQMVLTEAILSSEEDIIGVMQSVLMRVARARLGIREEPYGAYEKDIITEMLRPYQYAGLEGKTKEDLLSPTPIKEDEETLKRVIDILWKKQPDQTII
tara:strand:- start:10167 stop:12830 length:2664 start_codon:yes stop_codon:yes gene_type:complete